MKIINRYAAEIVKEPWGSRRSLTRLLKVVKERNPKDALILVALMYDKSLREVASDLQGIKGGEFAIIMSNGFIVNSLPELVNAGYQMGLIDSRWDDARRTD